MGQAQGAYRDPQSKPTGPSRAIISGQPCDNAPEQGADSHEVDDQEVQVEVAREPRLHEGEPQPLAVAARVVPRKEPAPQLGPRWDLARGEPVIKYPSPLNVRKDTYNHSCY